MLRKELLLPFLASVCILVLRLGAQQSGRSIRDPIPGTPCLSKAFAEAKQNTVN